MKAVVQVVNNKRGMYAAEIAGAGEYVIFELLDHTQPSIGDVVSHSNFYSMGRGTFRNETQQYDFDVCTQNVCGASLVRQQCFL